MTNQHPITPPDEMIEKWRTDYIGRGHAFIGVAKEIAQWGSDQELEACCQWLSFYSAVSDARDLRTARRPKPPSLKEQALTVLMNAAICDHLSSQDEAILRRALEALDD